MGHSGTTLVVRWLEALGWDVLDADDEFAESVRFREFNEFAWRNGYLPLESWDWLRSLPAVWVLKDPRLAVTLPYWRVPLEETGHEPLLLWVYRPLELVIASHRRRGLNVTQDSVIFGRRLREHLRLIKLEFDTWPYPRLFVDMCRLAHALRGFDPDRILGLGSQSVG